MTESTSSADTSPAPSVRSLVALLVLVGLVVVAGLVLFALTPAADRPNVWAVVPTLGPTLAVLVPSVLAVIGIRGLTRDTAAQTTTLAAIHHNTNGVLTQRIKDAVAEAMAQATPAPPPPPDATD